MSTDSSPARRPDPVIEAYKKDVDRTLIRERLKRTPAQRGIDFIAFAAFVDEVRASGAKRRRRA